MKVAFNLSQMALQLEAAIVVFHLLLPADRALGPVMWITSGPNA